MMLKKMTSRSETTECFCIGPQPGQTECPCAIRSGIMATDKEKMIWDSIVAAEIARSIEAISRGDYDECDIDWHTTLVPR